MLRTIIIDDEAAAVNNLRFMLEEHSRDVRVLACTTEATQGISLINDYKPDMVFLDISMPEINGFTLLKQLEHRDFKLVFTTAHVEYAIQAIRAEAHDYLLKPVNAEELKSCIQSVVQREEQTPSAIKRFPPIIELAVKNGIIFIRTQDIIRLEASGSYTNFCMEQNSRYVASKSLKEFEAQLDPRIFYRCHHSHLINLKKVDRFISSQGFYAQMSDGSRVEISRKQKDIFLEKLKQLSF